VCQLRPDERRLIAAVSVFAGGAAIVHLRQLVVAADLDASVAVLADAHLVTVVDRRGQARLTMLDTIREVVTDLVDVSTVRAMHAAHFAELLRTAEPPDAVDAERDNVRAALDWIVQFGQSNVDLDLVRALNRYFRGRGYFPEAYRVLTALAAVAADPGTRAEAQCAAGIAANENGEPAVAVDLARQAADGFTAVGDPTGRCTALALLGNAYKALGDYGRARASHTECLELARTVGVPRAVTVALNNLGTIAEELGDYAAAQAHYAESLSIKEKLGDTRGAAVARNNLGGLAAEIGDFAGARRHLSRAAAEFEAQGEGATLAFCLAMFSQAQLGCGEVAPARTSAERALQLAREVEYGHGVGLALARLGDIARDDGDHAVAGEWYGQALQQPIGLSETIRTLERLAAVTAGTDRDQARALLGEADRLRAEHQLPPSPTALAVTDAVRKVLDAG
jgi:tetratricopeptide (TPR) repeat protein